MITVARKHGKEKVTVLDPCLEDIRHQPTVLCSTKEQVMQVAQRFGGFSLGKADILKRAMGKKNAKEMHLMKEDFITGAMKLGHTEEKANQVFAVMGKVCRLWFNRSHAYAYSALAFQLAYFKTHYSAIFFQVMLNYSSSDYIIDALQMGFDVAPLAINSIPYHDKITQKKIYLGLKAIKGMPRDLSLLDY